MNEIEVGVLEACAAYAACQHEMLPQLAGVLGVEQSQVFYSWARRQFKQTGHLENGDWWYFFHGYECDFRNQRDGRFLRLDFGPKGETGFLDTYGVLRFVLASQPPWPMFPPLITYFAQSRPRLDPSAGDVQKMWHIWSGLEREGYFEHAELGLMNLLSNHTTRKADGLQHIEFPPEITEEVRIDCRVAHRIRLSQKSRDFLAASGARRLGRAPLARRGQAKRRTPV